MKKNKRKNRKTVAPFLKWADWAICQLLEEKPSLSDGERHFWENDYLKITLNKSENKQRRWESVVYFKKNMCYAHYPVDRWAVRAWEAKKEG